MVVQLARLKGLTESRTSGAAPGRGHEEASQPLMSLSTEEVFGLLDLNQDGLLQKQEVRRTERTGSERCPTGKKQRCALLSRS